MPVFQGGMEQLIKFLSANITYPAMAKQEGVQGRVFVNFVVEADGSVTNVKVLRGIGGGCDEEAVRVVNSMPNWTPGMQRGEAVRVSFNLPIRFTLD
jgi:protein TonB